MKKVIRLSRACFNHSFWTEKRTFSKFEAWLDLVSMANTDDEINEIVYKSSGKVCVFRLRKGELPIFINNLALSWNWSRTKTTLFLELLSNKNQMKVKKLTGKIRIGVICNFHEFCCLESMESVEHKNEISADEIYRNQKKVITSKNVLNGEKPYIIIKEKYSKEYSKKELSIDSETKPNADFLKFKEWMCENAPACSDTDIFPRQFTEKEFLELKKKYTGRKIAEVIEKLDNRVDLHGKYYNLPRTVKSWLKKEERGNV